MWNLKNKTNALTHKKQYRPINTENDLMVGRGKESEDVGRRGAREWEVQASSNGTDNSQG